MAFDAHASGLTIAVIGTGTMGRGIVQVSAAGGMNVIAFDEKPGAAQAAKDYIEKILGGLVEKGRMTGEDAAAAVGRIRVASAIEDVAKAHVVIEAIVERLDIKQPLFQKLDAMCGPEVILASNTSSLPVTAIGAKCARPERVAGLHFFNPVPLMKLVEVIPGLKTAAWVTEALMVIGRRMTREPVLCVDSPGFIVNHAGRGITEAQRVLIERIATHSEIDRVLTGAPGFKLGPFALADMVGMDIGHAVQESFFQQFYGEPGYVPSPLTALRVAGGMYGRKTQQGWYTYTNDKLVEVPVAPAPKALPKSVWVQPSASHPELQAPLLDLFKKAGVEVESSASPSATAVIVATPVGYDVSTIVSELKLDAKRTVAVDVLFGLKGPRSLMVSPATSPIVRDQAHALLASDGQQVVVINDSPGFIAQRVVAQIVNVGCQIAQRGIATPADIDKAVKLGLGYPYGPMEWGDLIGPRRVFFILNRLAEFYDEPRYRPSPWLKRRVLLGLPLSAPEGRDLLTGQA
ncbi:MAG: 3-hydroxyacyl-CoA dehydrogenase [Hyphomicrobiaceae bacterium]|nr:3-hydroxyacyl-CoA dehydrogenase [Hyphomicrobiaceae bacterium]